MYRPWNLQTKMTVLDKYLKNRTDISMQDKDGVAFMLLNWAWSVKEFGEKEKSRDAHVQKIKTL
jgi:hypothetical protein